MAAAPRVGERVLPGRRDHDRGGDATAGSGWASSPLLLFGLSWAATPSGVLHRPDVERLWTWLFRGSVLLGLAVLVSFVLAAAGGARGAWRWLAAAPRRAGLAPDRARQQIVVEGWEDELTMAREHVPHTYGRLLGLLALATIAADADRHLLSSAASRTSTALIVLAVAWTCLAEVTAEGPLRAFVVNTVPAAYDSLVSQQSRLGARLVGSARAGSARRSVASPRRRGRRLLSLRPLPEGLLKLSSCWSSAVVLFEIPNRGKTLLQPFKAAVVKPKQDEVPTVEQQAAIGQAVFDHLVNTLGVLTQDLQPDVILLLPPDPLRGAQFRTIAAGGSGSIDPFLSGPRISTWAWASRSPSVFVLTPDRQAGAVAARRADHRGQRPRGPPGLHGPRPVELGRGLAGATAAGSIPEPAVARTRLGGRPPAPSRDLALELAFRIMSAEPTLASVGMTRSWEAFDRVPAGARVLAALRGPERRAGPRRPHGGDPEASAPRSEWTRPSPWRTTGSAWRSRRTASRSPRPRRSGRA